jgi:tetratricopeptide (TPR) repeat protein
MRAVYVQPENARAQFDLGHFLLKAERFEPAAAAFLQAVVLDPAQARFVIDFGIALFNLGIAPRAARALGWGVTLAPDEVDAHHMRGKALYRAKDYRGAEVAYRRVLALHPEHAGAFANLAAVLRHLGAVADAHRLILSALCLMPDAPLVNYAFGTTCLTLGLDRPGWRYCDWRLHPTIAPLGPLPGRPWRGEDLSGQSIRVQAEQGLGDTIQFVRFVPMLKARGAKVTLVVQRQLLTLVRQFDPDIAVYGTGDMVPETDFYVALMSLPYALGLDCQTKPWAGPYLTMAPDARLPKGKRKRIGIAWSGNPINPHDLYRRMSLHELSRLFVRHDLEFHVLQAQISPEEQALIDRHPHVVTHDPQRDMTETAALIGAMDLVITIDTVIAHLAGALAAPTWVMLTYAADWRWGVDRADCPYYPSQRLYRQTHDGDWQPVLGSVLDELSLHLPVED